MIWKSGLRALHAETTVYGTCSHIRDMLRQMDKCGKNLYTALIWRFYPGSLEWYPNPCFGHFKGFLGTHFKGYLPGAPSQFHWFIDVLKLSVLYLVIQFSKWYGQSCSVWAKSSFWKCKETLTSEKLEEVASNKAGIPAHPDHFGEHQILSQETNLAI